MIYPKVIYKKFTYSPNVFKVLKDPFFPALLFYLKSFVRITTAYPIFADQILYSAVREDSGLSPWITSSCCVNHFSQNDLHCVLNIFVGNWAFRVPRISTNQSNNTCCLSGIVIFLPAPIFLPPSTPYFDLDNSKTISSLLSLSITCS